MTRLRNNHATIVAYLGLFIALGGISYAVVRVPANSVGTKQLKANAVISSKVKNRSLAQSDFKANQLLPGPTGPMGPPGPPVDQTTGPPTFLAPATRTCQSEPGSFCENPTFDAGQPRWVNRSESDVTYPDTGFAQDKAGFVHVEGAAIFLDVFATGDQVPIFYLPAGMRPTDGSRSFRVARCDGSDDHVGVVVTSDGAVTPDPWLFGGGCVVLDGIEFHP